jgi:peptidoglycan/LPS O-acetylase OafA/YrhL
MLDSNKAPQLPLSKKYFENLDGLRFFLAFAVFGGHSMLGVTLNSVIQVDFIQRIVTILTAGYLGVSFFFVLSGFLITYLMLEEKAQKRSFSIKNFYIRRILRIWPLYFAVVFFGFFVYPLIKTEMGYVDQNPYSIIHQVLFLSNFDSIRVHEQGLVGVAPLMIGITWSVSIEEQFYLVWPILFLIVPAHRFWVICLLVIIISWIFRLTTDPANLYYHTLTVISDMGMGGLGAFLSLNSTKFSSAIERLNRYFILAIYLAGFGVLIYADRIPFVLATFRIFTGVFFCFILIEQCFAPNSFFKFSNLKTITALGKYTYALYMLHPIGIQTSIIIFRLLSIQRDENLFYGLFYVLLAFAVSMTLSILSFLFVEKYFLNKRKLFN